jgi:hypothetical protein
MDNQIPEKPSQPVVSVKMPAEMREWLKRTAKQGYRSMNAQVLLILDAARRQEASREHV